MGNGLISPRNAKVYSYSEGPIRRNLKASFNTDAIKPILEKKDWKSLHNILVNYPDLISNEIPSETDKPIMSRALLLQVPLNIIEAIVEANKHCFEADSKGNFPLHYAAKKEPSHDIINYLLEQDLSALEKGDSEGNLPLHVALKNNPSIDFIMLLLERNPNSIRIRNKLGFLPLHLACIHRVSFDIIKYLVEANPESVNQTCNSNLPIHFASQNKASLETIMLFLTLTPKSPDIIGSDGRYPIHFAVESKSNIEVIKLLVKQNPNALLVRDKSARLPLHYALENKSPEDVLNILIEIQPLSVQQRGRGTPGDYPLVWSISNHFPVQLILKILFLFPEAARQKDVYGMFPLRLAIKEKLSLELIAALLEEHPIAASESDEKGRVALHYAASRNFPFKLVESLIKFYPQGVSKIDTNGQIPLHFASIRLADTEIFKILLDRFPQGAASVDKYFNNSLNYIIEQDGPPILYELLIKSDKRCLSLPHSNGKLPLNQAIEFNRSFQVIEQLVLNSKESVEFVNPTNGYLPLHLAIIRPMSINILLLIEEANPLAANFPDNQGFYPIHYALLMKSDNELVIRLLKQNVNLTLQEEYKIHRSLITFQKDPTKSFGMTFNVSPLTSSNLCCNGVSMLLHFGINHHCLPESLAEILLYTMPYHPQTEILNTQHYYTWSHVACHTNDEYWKSIEIVLTRYSVDCSYKLSEFYDENLLKVLDQATPLSHRVIIHKLFFFSRYELHNNIYHLSPTTMLKIALDHNDQRKLPIILKFMSSLLGFENEIKLREKYLAAFQEKSQYLLPLVSKHHGDEDYNYLQEINRKRFNEYRYLLVYPRGDKTLLDMVYHDNLAGNISQYETLVKYSYQLLQCVNMLHQINIIHGNLSPSHLIFFQDHLTLHDFCFADEIVSSIQNNYNYVAELEPGVNSSKSSDISIKLDNYFNRGRRCLAYVAPEMANLYIKFQQLKSTLTLSSLPKASVAIDMWSVGAILYYLFSGESLFLSNPGHSIDGDQLDLLSQWSPVIKQKRMKKIPFPLARNLIEQLLSKDPLMRPNAQESLSHPLFVNISSTSTNINETTASTIESCRYLGMPAKSDIYMIFRPLQNPTKISEKPKIIASDDIVLNPSLILQTYHNHNSIKQKEKEAKESLLNSPPPEIDNPSDIEYYQRFEKELTDLRYDVLSHNELSVEAKSILDDSILEESLIKLSQNKSCFIILSRNAVNHSEFNIGNLHKDSAFNLFLFEIYLALELQKRGLLEKGIFVIAIGDRYKTFFPPKNVENSERDNEPIISFSFDPFFSHHQKDMTKLSGNCIPSAISPQVINSLETAVSRILTKFGFGKLFYPQLTVQKMFQIVLQSPTFHVLGEEKKAFIHSLHDINAMLQRPLRTGNFSSKDVKHSSSHRDLLQHNSLPYLFSRAQTPATHNSSSRGNLLSPSFQRALDTRIPSPDINHQTNSNWFRDREPNKPSSPVHHFTLQDIVSNSRPVTSNASLFNLDSTGDRMASSTFSMSFREQDIKFINNERPDVSSGKIVESNEEKDYEMIVPSYFTEISEIYKNNMENLFPYMVEKLESKDTEINNMKIEMMLMDEKLRLQQEELHRLRTMVQVTHREDRDVLGQPLNKVIDENAHNISEIEFGSQEEDYED